MRKSVAPCLQERYISISFMAIVSALCLSGFRVVSFEYWSFDYLPQSLLMWFLENMIVSVGLSTFTPSPVASKGSEIQFLTLAYRKHNRERTDPIFAMNKIEASCDRADSTFVNSQQNTIKMFKLFLNNSPTIVTLQLSTRLVHRSLSDTHLSHFLSFFATHFSADFWKTDFEIRRS